VNWESIRRITRGLRFRLAVSYALFFALLLSVIGAVFHRSLSASLDTSLREVLDQEWGSLKALLRIENGGLYWVHDRQDREEAFLVARIQRILFVTDGAGTHLALSGLYRTLGPDPPEQIRDVLATGQTRWSVRETNDGQEYLLRAGVIHSGDEGRRPYYVSIGRSLEDSRRIVEQFTQGYLVAAPLLIALVCFLGWLLAGRALLPVVSLAAAAGRISGSNLSLRIPTRGADDELDHLIVTFNGMMERLETSFRQIQQFSADVSHELRTPLTALRGQLEIALMTAPDANALREAIIASLDDVERLTQIVRALLQLAQAETGQVALQRAPTDLTASVRGILEQFELAAEEANVRLEHALPPACQAEVDRVQFERMLSNLLSNAIKFTPAGGRVLVSLTRESEQILLEVEDTGCGIPEEALPYIFTRFYRVSGSAATREKGLGLGLSFVQWIARAHGGRVEVHSRLGEGTRFTVYLPLAAEGESARSADPVRA